MHDTSAHPGGHIGQGSQEMRARSKYDMSFWIEQQSAAARPPLLPASDGGRYIKHNAGIRARTRLAVILHGTC